MLRSGSYHENVNIPSGKSLTIQNYPGEAAWFDGSSSITNWVANGNLWRSDGWTHQFDDSPTYTPGAKDNSQQYFGFVNAAYPMASHPEQLFVDNAPLQQVKSLSQVGPNSFFVDLPGKRLYMGHNPQGHTVRASDLTMALNISGGNSTLRGFGVVRYATSVPLLGTVRVLGSGVRLENLLVAENATQGVFLRSSNITVNHVTSQNNGMMGFSGAHLDGLHMTGVRVTGNNDEHFNTSPAAGGFKMTASSNIVISGSVFSNNYGSGIWMDLACNNAIIVGNNLVANEINGVSFEVSHTGTFANNVMDGNGQVGLKINNSSNISIWNNTLVNNKVKPTWLVQDSRTTYRLGPLMVKNNIFSRTQGLCLMCVEDAFLHRSAAAIGVTTDGNVYNRASPGEPRWLTVWASGATNPSVYTTLSAFRAATRQEMHGIELDGAPVVNSRYQLTNALLGAQAGVAQPLDARVAGLVGQPAGGKHLGAFV